MDSSFFPDAVSTGAVNLRSALIEPSQCRVTVKSVAAAGLSVLRGEDILMLSA